MNKALKKSTQHEIDRLLNSGCSKVSYNELKDILKSLGYEIEAESSFNYINTANEITYKAKSCYIVESDTGLSFANIEARKDENFKELQRLRRSGLFAVTNHGAITEL